MEVLGIASGIAGLIGLAEIIAFRGSKFCSRVKNARSDIRELLVEVQSLYGVLNSLKLLATCLEDDDPTLKHASCSGLDHFQTCRKNLDLLKKSIEKLDLDSVKAKLVWPFKVSETKELIERIGRNKRDLSDALTADGMSTLLTALSTNSKILETVQNVQLNFERFTKEWAENEEDEHRRKMYDWCSTANPYEKHRTSKALRHPNTVLWFFDSPEYTEWLEQPTAAIWLYGIPGAGKTILTSAVIEEAKRLAYDNPGYALGYYYCEDKLRDTQMVSNILGSLIRQLCAESEDAFNDLEKVYQKSNTNSKNPTRPSNEDFVKLLKAVFHHFECVMLIIDGLDECQIPGDRNNLLDILLELKSVEQSNLKIVCTSRDEIDIRRSFTEFDKISIAARGTDLELFVAATIETRIKKRILRLRDPSLKEAIINGIVSKANGMFQWAKCQIDHVCLLSTDKERRRALESLPTDLFETYRRILSRVNESTESNKSMVEKTLRWLAFSSDEMFSDELLTAIAIHFQASFVDEDDLPDEESVLWWCSSLISKSESTRRIQLSHFTVKEFLMDDRLAQSPDLQRYHFTEGRSNMILGRVCLTYLCMDVFAEPSSRLWQHPSELEEFPLLEYSAQFWPSHCRAYEEDNVVYHLLCRLFDPLKTPNFQVWSSVIYGIAVLVKPLSASTIHYAAGIGLTKVCEWLLEQDVDVNRCDEALGTPLICAIRGSFLHPSAGQHIMHLMPNPETIKLLLRRGAVGDAEVTLVSKQDSKSPALVPALVWKYTPMCLLLDQYWDDPAVICRILQVLMDARAVSSFSNSSIWPSIGTTRLRDDTGNRRMDALVETFKKMLAHPSSKYLDTASEEKMLSFIARNSTTLEDPSLVSERLGKEGLLNATMPISRLVKDAVANGQTYLLKSLIERGATTASLSNALIDAVNSKSEETLNLLTSKISFDEETVYVDVQAAVKQAAIIGWTDGIKTMIEHGVDVNMTWSTPTSTFNMIYTDHNVQYATTLLRTAVIFGQIELIRFLFSPAVSSILKDDSADLLHLAVQAHQHHVEITIFLLEQGIPVKVNHNGLTLLHSFFGSIDIDFDSGDEQFVRDLIRLGSPLGAIDTNGNSLLHALLKSTHSAPYSEMALENIIRIINNDGKLLTKANAHKQIPLHIAISRKLPSRIIELMIPDTGTLKFVSNTDRPVLHILVSREFENQRLDNYLRHGPRILDVLLKIDGIVVDVKNEQDLTPLLAVGMNCSQNPSIEEAECVALTIKKLLERGANVNAACPQGITLLHLLSAKRHVLGLKEALKYNPDIYALNKAGNWAFDLAVAYGGTESVDVLIAHDAASLNSLEPIVSRRNGIGFLPIHVATWNKAPEVAQLLHHHGEQYLNEPILDANKETALHLAVRQNDFRTFAAILQLGADVNARNAMKQTPLHHAASFGTTEVVHRLLAHGADVFAEDEHGSQPWVAAALSGHTALADLLLKATHENAGSRNLTNNKNIGSEFLGSESVAPLARDAFDQDEERRGKRLASHFRLALEVDNSTRVCEALLRTGINSNMVLNEDKDTAAHVASRSDSDELMKLLIENGARIDTRNLYGDLPIHIAAWQGNCKVLAVLIENGADIAARNSDLETSLHIASAEGKLDAVKSLLEYATKNGTKSTLMEYRDHDRETALMKSLDADDLSTSKYLIEQGANVHTLDFWRLSTLNAAVHHGDKELIQMLVSRGVDVNKRTYSGFNCLHSLAKRFTKPEEWAEHLEISKLLIEAGADISSNNSSNSSALHAACHSGSKLLVEELLRLSAPEEINVESSFYGSPLHAAAIGGHIEVVKVLLDAGADVSKGLAGESSLQAAVAERYVEVAELLKNAGQQQKWKHSMPGAIR